MADVTTTVRLAGVADILGVSRQAAANHAHRPDFPAPVSTDELGRRWSRTAVEEYARQRKEAAQ